jgi:hypothetical protein
VASFETSLMAAKTKHLEALPPGYKFNPTDAELVDDYLLKKASGMAFYEQDFQEIDTIEFYCNPPQSLGIACHFLSFSFLLNTDLCVRVYIYIYIYIYSISSKSAYFTH